MASYICSIDNGKAYFVDKVGSGIKAALRVSKMLRESNELAKDTNIRWKQVKRFITIYGEYIDLEDGNIDDFRPIMISEMVNGKLVVYAKEYGLHDKKILYAV